MLMFYVEHLKFPVVNRSPNPREMFAQKVR
jgi:hypothetical protein